MTQTMTGFEIKREISIRHTASVVNVGCENQITFEAATEDDWAGYLLYKGDTLIAEAVCYNETIVRDQALAREYLISAGEDAEEVANADGIELQRMIAGKLDDPDKLYDRNLATAQKRAIKGMIESDGLLCFRAGSERGFANEYDLLLATPEKADMAGEYIKGAYSITADQWADDWAAYTGDGEQRNVGIYILQ